MTQALRAMATLRARGLHATPTHLLVRAAALALQRHPDTHRLVCGYRAICPGRVDIGLSVAGQTSYAPVLVIQDAGRKRLSDLVPEIIHGVAEARRKESEDLRGMRRTGWVIPWGVLRRLILRWLYRSFWFRRRLAGTFQVTCLNNVDQAFPLAFYTGSALAMGRVTDRVVALGGAPVVRPMAWLTLALDHKALDGRMASRLLNAVREILEGEELVQEASL
ncbi:MAG: 2-oxo acid dehydrogenase subunit E2 [Myxococcales bacterium]|nr:2-oxo acid dehydrogenase subunit E2 [Myxococcales bacterium]